MVPAARGQGRAHSPSRKHSDPRSGRSVRTRHGRPRSVVLEEVLPIRVKRDDFRPGLALGWASAHVTTPRTEPWPKRYPSEDMTPAELDVTGIGNAIVDVLCAVEDDFIANEGIVKGSMVLISAERALELSSQLGRSEQRSGGSAGNTVAGLAILGSSVGYIGKVGDDALGRTFADDLQAAGVRFTTPPSTKGTPTARCIVLVSPDAQRTMCTYLGACVELGPEDVDPGLVARSRVTYLEGYLWDPPRAREAFVFAAQAAHSAGRLVSLSLSDSFCVDRHRDSLLEFVRNHVDVLFANETELLSLHRTDDLRAAMTVAKEQSRVVAVTRGAQGSIVADRGEVQEFAAEPVARVIDTTGAGDLFAAGFLHGLCRDRGAAECAAVGSIAAAEVISHFGARPEGDLRDLVSRRVAF